MKDDYYYLKYQKIKERLLNENSSILENQLEYIFQDEKYINKLKLLEFDLFTIEYFYNIFFNRFNIDSWLNKSILSSITLELNKILQPFTHSNELTSIDNTYSLGFFQNLRNYLMYQLSQNKTIKIYSNSLEISYICILTSDKIVLFNKYHSFNKIIIEDSEEINLKFNIDKHILIQFLINPFWCVETSEINKEFSNKIINPDWSIINISEDMFLNSTLKKFNENFIEKYINTELELDIVNINSIIDKLYYIINLQNVHYIIKYNIFNIIKSLRDKIETSTDLVILNEPNYDNEELEKQIIYSFIKPIHLLQKNVILDKRNVFTKKEIELYNNSNLTDLNPDDLAIVLPIIFENKQNLIDISHCFFQNKSEIPKDKIRKDILLSQIPNVNGKKSFSVYGIKYLLEANNKKIELKSHFIWNETLWLFNMKMMELTKYDLFDLINNQSWLTYKNILTLLELPLSIESKIIGLLTCYELQSFENLVFFYLEYNMDKLLHHLKEYSIPSLSINKKKIITTEFGIPDISYEISMSQLYANYLINNKEIHDILTRTTNYETNIMQYIFYNNIYYECNIICKHIKKYYQLDFNISVYDSYIKLFSLKRKFDNIWDFILIDGKIPALKNISINYYLKEFYLSFKNNKVFMNKNNNINEDEIIINVTNENNIKQYILAELFVIEN